MHDAPSQLHEILNRPHLQSIFALLPQARLVGGCVRDACLGSPVKDIDIALPMLPEKAMRILREAGFKVLPTGIEHGTITVVLDHHPYEITSLRRDVEHDGRRAKIIFTEDWREDAMRRDLTINALYCDSKGTIFDYATGIDDLRNGRVRFMGRAFDRMQEDYLRILRFFRFHAFYAKGDFDSEALEAAKALQSHLSKLSGERLAQETLKLLLAPRVVETWREMSRSGIVDSYFPPQSVRDERIGEEGKICNKLERLLKREAYTGIQPDALRRLAAMTDPNQGAVVAERLKLSNAQKNKMKILTRPQEFWTAIDFEEEGWTSDQKIRCALYKYGGEIVRDMALIQDWSRWDRALALAAQWKNLILPLKGEDVVALGIEPGPDVGLKLAQVEDWWKDNDFLPDRAACLSYLQRLIDKIARA